MIATLRMSCRRFVRVTARPLYVRSQREMRSGRFAVAFLAAGWVIALTSPAAHADEGWVITSFHSEISIAPDSAIVVQEDIRVDFRGLQKMGFSGRFLCATDTTTPMIASI